ncbi:hypothetical protein [Spiroplasma endosymbiont of Dactylopius coccus]
MFIFLFGSELLISLYNGTCLLSLLRYWSLVIVPTSFSLLFSNISARDVVIGNCGLIFLEFVVVFSFSVIRFSDFLLYSTSKYLLFQIKNLFTLK